MNINKIKEIKEIVEKIHRRISGVLAVGYKNLRTGEEFFYNEEHVFPAASIVKICILLEYFHQIELSKICKNKTVLLKKEDKVGGAGVLMELHEGLQLTLEDLVILTVVISDNTASNIMLDQLGMDEINDFMNSLGLKDTVIGRKFMIDPNAKFSKNFTSIRDMVPLLEKLYKGEILNKENTQSALDILSRQQYNEKIPLLLPSKVKIAHKTGEITGVRHDCGIILHEENPCILCFLTEKLPDVVEGDRALAELSLEFYKRTVCIQSPRHSEFISESETQDIV